jgi:hypothetical protein
MGIFYEQVEVVNRTATPKMVTFDGQRIYLDPNYDEVGDRIEGVVNMIPVQCVPYALNQNVIMGSEEVLDPSAFQSMVGVVFKGKESKRSKKKSWHDCTFFDEAGVTEITRVPQEQIMEEYVADPKAQIVTRGKKIPPSQNAALGVTTAPFDLRTS